MTEVAIARLDDAAFVGLTEDWNDSICLFHAMYGSELSSHSFENVRSTASFTPQYKSTVAQLDPADDPHDWAFYVAAKVIFRQRQRIYGLPLYEVPRQVQQ